MQLTQDQQEAKDKLLSFLLSDEKEIILQGHAGTGKTFLIKDVYDTYQDMMRLDKAIGMNGRDWDFLATTHKACESLSACLDEPVHTVHKYYGISIYDTYNKNVKYKSKNIIVIDECSYLNYAQLEAIRHISCNDKIIYMGDEKQLAPVGLNHAPVFYDDVPSISLSTTVRQKNAPQIAQYCEELRLAIKDGLNTPKPIYSDEIIHLSENKFFDKMIETFKIYDSTKALACRNATIIRYNKFIHKELTGSEEMTLGDIVVANATTELVKNNKEYTVTDITKGEFLSIKGHYLTLDNHINIFTPNGVTGIKRAIKHAFNTNQPHLIRQLADMRLSYASTIHKAQGSTYDYVFLDLSELKQIKTRDEINRLLYVAFSRATTKVYVIGEIP